MDNADRHTLELTHRTDKMCLDKLQHTHGSVLTAGSTAYTIVKKIEKMFDDLKTWLTTKFSDLITALNPETITQAEVQAMWSDEEAEVTYEGNYLVGATMTDDNYLVLDGIELDNNNNIKLK